MIHKTYKVLEKSYCTGKCTRIFKANTQEQLNDYLSATYPNLDLNWSFKSVAAPNHIDSYYNYSKCVVVIRTMFTF